MRPGVKQFSVLIPEKKMPSAAQSWGIEQSEAKCSQTLMRKKEEENNYERPPVV
jgi:hypothetical protein